MTNVQVGNNPYEVKNLENFIFPDSKYFNASYFHLETGSAVVVNTEKYLASMTSVEREEYIECTKEFFRIFGNFSDAPDPDPLKYDLFYLWWNDESKFYIGIKCNLKTVGRVKIFTGKDYKEWNKQVSTFKKQLVKYISTLNN